jgi:hypothetical protein
MFTLSRVQIPFSPLSMKKASFGTNLSFFKHHALFCIEKRKHPKKDFGATTAIFGALEGEFDKWKKAKAFVGYHKLKTF